MEDRLKAISQLDQFMVEIKAEIPVAVESARLGFLKAVAQADAKELYAMLYAINRFAKEAKP